jgi:hypothetical protein
LIENGDKNKYDNGCFKEIDINLEELKNKVFSEKIDKSINTSSFSSGQNNRINFFKQDNEFVFPKYDYFKHVSRYLFGIGETGNIISLDKNYLDEIKDLVPFFPDEKFFSKNKQQLI